MVASFKEMPIPNHMGKVPLKKTTILLTGLPFIEHPGMVTRQKSVASDTVKKYNPPYFITTALLLGFYSPSSEPPFLTRLCEP
jgi:hypothetical protein